MSAGSFSLAARLLSSIHEFFAQINSSFSFIYPQKARIIHSTRLQDASTYSPFRFESVYGEKNALERKKIPLFSLLLFSSLWFQAAMPHGRSLLQATSTPTEPTGWSSALQSEEPTAGSRQLHKKQLQADASDRKKRSKTSGGASQIRCKPSG